MAVRRCVSAAAGIPILLVMLAAAPPAAFAQSNTGTAIGQFTLIEPAASIAAMGNAGVSLYDGIQAVYYNPAALGTLESPAVMFTHSFWFADIRYDYAAVGFPVRGVGNFFGSVTALNSGDIDVRTVQFPLGTGERYSVSDVALGLGYGRRITSRFAAGIQANYIAESIWHSTASTVTFNVGTVYRLAEEGLRIGASISNFGTKSHFSGDDLAIQFDNNPANHGDNSALPGEQFTGDYPVPILFRVGVSLPRKIGSDSRILFAVDALHPSDNTESVALGSEWSWRETVSLRAGYQDIRTAPWRWRLFQNNSDSGLGPTLGVGIRAGSGHPWFHFDYAWAHHDRLESTHRLTFSAQF